MARRTQPYHLKELQGADFLDFKEHSKCLTNFDKDDNDEKVKWMESCLFQQTIKTLSWYSCTQEHSVILLPNTGIYRDLQILCTSGVIPSTYHPFYKSLMYE
ncbi:hypothetical protein LSAT2_021135 [Lamellibrachia satsuma]|nr:hypothetical protein LSAT2_021135 [Lamellibrachia satsuma]